MLTRTSTALLEGLKDGADRRAWGEFDRRYRPLILALGRRLGLSAADAEDAGQETMLAFVRAYGEGQFAREKGRLRDWLRGMAVHKIQEAVRRRGRGEKLVGDRPGETGLWERQAGPGLEELWEAEWEKAVLRGALAEVRGEVAAKTFEAFELYALKQWPVGEVARHLGVSEDVVYQSKRRVLQRLRQAWPRVREIW